MPSARAPPHGALARTATVARADHTVFASERVVVGEPAPVAASDANNEEPVPDGQARSTSSGSLPVGLPSASRVIFSTRASAWASNSSQRFFSA
jgi:hypothetical protein